MIKKFYSKKYTQISVYVIIVAAIIIGFYAFIDNTSYFINLVTEKIMWVVRAAKPIIGAIVLAYLLDPIVRFFEKSYKGIKFFKNRDGACRGYAIFTTMLLMIVLIAAMISLTVFSITEQIRLADFSDIFDIPVKYVDMINSFYNMAISKLTELDIRSVELQNYVQTATTFLLDKMKFGADIFVTSISNVTGFIANMVIAIVLAIYLLGDGRKAMSYVGKISSVMFSEKLDRKLKNLVKDADEVFSGYIRGQITDALIMMFLISIGLSIIDVQFAIIIGVFAGIGNLIPYVGPFIAYAGVVLVSFFTGDWKKCIIAVIFLLIIQAVDGNFIGPKLLSNSIKIHPFLVIVFIVFGSAIGGLTGMLLAVPIGSLIKVEFTKYIDNKYESKYNNNVINNEVNNVNDSEIEEN